MASSESWVLYYAWIFSFPPSLYLSSWWWPETFQDKSLRLWEASKGQARCFSSLGLSPSCPQFSSLGFSLVLHLCIFFRWTVTWLMVWFPAADPPVWGYHSTVASGLALHPSISSLPTPKAHHPRIPGPRRIYTFCISGKEIWAQPTSISLGFIF